MTWWCRWATSFHRAERDEYHGRTRTAKSPSRGLLFRLRHPRFASCASCRHIAGQLTHTESLSAPPASSAEALREVSRQHTFADHLPSGCREDDADGEVSALRRSSAIGGERDGTEEPAIDGERLDGAGAAARDFGLVDGACQFEYGGCCINLLDTPGHKDFSEDTYRVLTAVDAVVMVIDAGKGIEAQTRKLFEVCRRREGADFHLYEQAGPAGASHGFAG